MKREGGFTLVEFILVVVIVVLLGGWLFSWYTEANRVTGTWKTKPANVSQGPATGIFVWNIDTSSLNTKANRTTSFSVQPVPGVLILSLNGKSVDAPTGTEITDASGNVVVVLQVDDYIGSASVAATDTATGGTETAAFQAVQ